MKILLAGPDFEENLSVRYLSSSLLAAGHDTTLAAFNAPSDIPSVAEAAPDADIVALSMCFQSRAQEFLRLARLLKSRHPEQLIVAGGHYASCAAEPLLAHHPEIDIIVIHEGERTLVEIADAMPHLEDCLPQISGIAYRDGRPDGLSEGRQIRFTTPRRTTDHLDALPFPDRRGPIHLLAGVPTSYMMGSRGCYGSCAYCCITTLHQLAPGKRFRQRDVEGIADEMSTLYHERGTRQFVFHDDNFLVPAEPLNHARLSAFEKALKKRGVTDIALVIKCRPAEVNRRVFQRLKDLGLVRVFLGVESASSSGLADLERSQTVVDSERALETCASLDISAQFTLMIFHPDATLDTLRSDVAFMRRFSGNPLNFCRAEIYAGTPLEKRMIALGRARGDYLARVYSLSDPVADLACSTSLGLFEARCWSGGSLMQTAIGLDHLAATCKRFNRSHSATAVCRGVASWIKSVNLDNTDLLDEVLDLSSFTIASGQGSNDAIRDTGFNRAVLAIRERESRTRHTLLSQGSNLRSELEALRVPSKRPELRTFAGSHLRLARQAAVAVLAIGMPAMSGCQSGVSEMAPPPLRTQTPQDNQCSLSGTLTDSMGAVVTHATITITNLDTGLTLTLKPNEAGQYVANDLHSGRYEVKAESPGFKTTVVTGIVLKAAERGHADIKLQMGYGCCEYAAGPLKIEDLTLKHKPFTYVVGDAADGNTFQGIAKQVYGDSKLWVQIFEANRKVVEKLEFIPDGTPILIPPRKRVVPKLISKTAPIYPAAAARDHIHGDAVLDVTLKDDGAVDGINVIDGNPVFAEAATAAVRQWRYQPLLLQGKPVLKFVVVVSFGKDGKVH